MWRGPGLVGRNRYAIGEAVPHNVITLIADQFSGSLTAMTMSNSRRMIMTLILTARLHLPL
jgi:hypothetical protein